MTRNFLFFSICLLFPVAVIAQRAAPALPPVDTVYMDQDWTRTAVKEDVKYARLARRSPDGHTTGMVRDFYYPSWKKQGEGKLLSESPDMMTGLCTGWHENGQMAFRGTYVQGIAQGDFQRWNEAGKMVSCKIVYLDIPVTPAPTKLHSRTNWGESSTVYSVVIPGNIDGLFYALDIRDEDEPPITLATAVSLTATALTASATGGTSLALAAGKAVMNVAQVQAENKPHKLTNCRYLITADASVAQYYKSHKGLISHPLLIKNRPTGADIISIPPGCRQIYICISNDNEVTAAIAQLVIKGVVQKCQ